MHLYSLNRDIPSHRCDASHLRCSASLRFMVSFQKFIPRREPEDASMSKILLKLARSMKVGVDEKGFWYATYLMLAINPSMQA